MILLCSSVAVFDTSLALNSSPSLILLMISSSSSSCNRPCFLNLSALFYSCSIIVLRGGVRNFPFLHKSFSFTHVVNNWCCLLAALLLLNIDACCWSLLRLEVPCPLDNPPCACVVSPPPDIEGRSVMTICHLAPRCLHQQNWRQEDLSTLRGRSQTGCSRRQGRQRG